MKPKYYMRILHRNEAKVIKTITHYGLEILFQEIFEEIESACRSNSDTCDITLQDSDLVNISIITEILELLSYEVYYSDYRNLLTISI